MHKASDPGHNKCINISCANLHAAKGGMLAQALSAAPLLLRQDTAVPAAAAAAADAADAAGCLVTVSMELAPIVMVMGQGREPQ